jgi:hypothetical protein
MSYGPRAGLVDAIVEFAERGPLLRPAAPITGAGLHVITDFAEAKEHAWHRYITDDEDAANWTDLRELEASEVLAATYADPSLAQLFDEMMALIERLHEAVGRQLAAPHQEVIDDIIADLRNCAFSQAVFGPGSRFFDRIWDVYRQGGWPCGWEGPYPEGRLVVFQPPVVP